MSNPVTIDMCDTLYQEMNQTLSRFEGLNNSYRYILENSSIDPKIAAATMAAAAAVDSSANSLLEDSVNTTERKAYYEHKEIDYIEKVHRWIRFLYWIMFFTLVACILLIYKQINLYSAIILLIFFLYPFVEKHLVGFVRMIFEFILRLFHHNTYVAL